MSGIYWMLTITKRSMERKMRAFYESNGLHEILGTLAKGTATSETLDCFGLEVTEKLVMMSAVTDESWKRIKQGLEEKIQIDIPGTGIVFLIPLSSIGGGTVFRFLTDGQVYEREEESVMKNTKYELIVVIANHGHCERVMDAAKKMEPAAGLSYTPKAPDRKKPRSFLGFPLPMKRT